MQAEIFHKVGNESTRKVLFVSCNIINVMENILIELTAFDNLEKKNIIERFHLHTRLDKTINILNF